MLFISDLSNNEQPLLVNDVHVTKQLNAVEQIDFTTINVPENESAFKMLQPRSIVTLPETNEMYRISENDGATMGSQYQRTLTGLQVLQDLDDRLVEDKLSGVQTIESVMDFLIKGTKFTYTVHDPIKSFDFGEDGIGGEHALSIFTDTVVSDFKIEFTTNGYHIDIYNALGKRNAFVFISGEDIYTLAETGDYTQIRTHIYGEGKTTETTTDTGSSSDSSDSSSDDSKDTSKTTSSTIKAEYTSPNASIYGIIDDDLYTNDNATTQQQLIDEMKAKLVDYPLIQYTANTNKFEEANPAGKLNDASMGNWGFIKDRNGTDIETRIIQEDLYPQSNQEDTLTFGNFVLDPNKMLAKMQSNHSYDMKTIKDMISKTSNNNSSTTIENQFGISKVGEVTDD
ncbi:prophage endopeptidase tail family protein [Companilactobacillus mishanensis]|uniref:Uncharacterized protein n=1 Tax=Companilactobacillus mishanensis TaxID=2486008 RepID=A0A5P0ZF28_9LACO|nr:prophage endopeptidase tail family protein [Companilactobacillus mishanensis]MQS44238.1 hypothetical protein [Companilactobacillus mishanensis]MQS51657.1 hypothetical protein [Companilactobacillus mishanensis]